MKLFLSPILQYGNAWDKGEDCEEEEVKNRCWGIPVAGGHLADVAALVTLSQAWHSIIPAAV